MEINGIAIYTNVIWHYDPSKKNNSMLNKAIVITLMFSLLLILSCKNQSEDANISNDYAIDIRVDPTVELFCTIHRLAKTNQYATNKFPRYIDDIEDYFEKFQDHSAVQLAIHQRNQNRINGSAPMSLAVYLNLPTQLTSKNDLFPSPDGLDHRWTENEINTFIEAAKSFSTDSDFMKFFYSKQELYNRSINNLHNYIKNDSILEWFNAYFGYQPGIFSIILGMQNGHSNYGLTVTHSDSTKEYIAILGASAKWWNGTPKFADYWIIPTIVHEFCHSYINPLVNNNYNNFKLSADQIFKKEPPVSYNHPETMMHEYLVRACTIRFFYSKNDIETITRRIKIDKTDGFPAIEELVELLNKYEKNRNRYATLSEFIPEIQLFFTSYASSL